MRPSYPFDPSLKSHAWIAVGLSIWIFLFLYFTEPLDVNQFSDSEKFGVLIAYGLLGGVSYLAFYPLQQWMYRKNKQSWQLHSELLFILGFSTIGIFASRWFYLLFIVPGEAYPYTLNYHLRAIILPALVTILPIILIGRYAFGKYKQKQNERKKITIHGEGNYENLRLHLEELICIQSADNYVEIYFLSGSLVKKNLIRTKISKLAEKHPELIQVHRSYLANPYHFKQILRQQGKYVLSLGHQIEIPISKTYLSAVKTQLNSATS